MERPQLLPIDEYLAAKAHSGATSAGGTLLTIFGGIVLAISTIGVVGLSIFTYAVVSSGRPPDDMTLPPYVTITGIVILAVCALFGCLAIRCGISLFETAAAAPKVALLTREAVAQLPLTETLVRASEQPAADADALMRPAVAQSGSGSEDALRPADRYRHQGPDFD